MPLLRSSPIELNAIFQNKSPPPYSRPARAKSLTELAGQAGPTSTSRQRLFAFRDLRTFWSHLGIEGDVVVPFFRYVFFVEDGLYWAFMKARVAIDTVLGVDVQHLLPLVKA